MRHLVLLLLAGLALAFSSLRAQSTDPGDLFVNAYMAVQAGEKAEQAGNFREATSKFRYASQMLDQISEKFPTWQPQIVEYRKKRTAEAMTRVQERLGKTGGAKAPASSKAPPEAVMPPGADPSELFAVPEGVLPGTPPTSRREPNRAATEPDLPSRNPIQEIDERMRRLQSDLDKARAEVEKEQQANADLAKKLEKAVEARQAALKRQELLETRAAAAEDALVKARSQGQADSAESKALVDELAMVRKQLRDLKFEGDADSEYRQQINDRLRAKQEQIRKLTAEKAAAEKLSADVPGKVGEIQKQLEQARKEKTDLTTRLTKTETDLKQALEQRDEALAQVTRMKEAQKQVDKLLADNASLMEKLGEAEKTISLVRADGVKKDQEIAALRKETVSLKEQLTQAQKESGEYQRQMGVLQQKLNDANTQITQMKADSTKSLAERNRLQEENSLLRGVVLRQQKEEARRAQTKKLVLGELAKLEGKSKVLMDQIEYLSGPVVKLSAKERALFKRPELQISDNEITFTGAQPDEATPASGDTALPGPETIPTVAKTDTKPAEPKPAETAAGPQPPKNVPPPSAAENQPAKDAEPTPGLSLASGAKPEMELASSKGTTTSLPPDTTKSPLTPELPAKTTDEAAGQNPLSTSGAGTGNTSGAAMNLPAELASVAREAKDQFERGNYRDAEKSYERILTKAPNNLYTLSNLGVVYFRSGKLKRAEEMFKKSIAIAPEDGFSHCTLGIVYYSQQKYDEAVTELTKALAVNSRNATAHNYLGITASQKGWQDAALKELTAATTLDPNYADAHFNLAVVYATMTPPNKDEAQKYYKRATELGAEADSALEQLIK